MRVRWSFMIHPLCLVWTLATAASCGTDTRGLAPAGTGVPSTPKDAAAAVPPTPGADAAPLAPAPAIDAATTDTAPKPPPSSPPPDAESPPSPAPVDAGRPDAHDAEPCPAPRTACGGGKAADAGPPACVDLAVDEANCGSCGNDCKGNRRCVRGMCTDNGNGGPGGGP
jgi:hypothetical protein